VCGALATTLAVEFDAQTAIATRRLSKRGRSENGPEDLQDPVEARRWGDVGRELPVIVIAARRVLACWRAGRRRALVAVAALLTGNRRMRMAAEQAAVHDCLSSADERHHHDKNRARQPHYAINDSRFV
jgi:hypothetical protein